MKEITREELFASDRGEREYYESKKSLKEKIRIPLTIDGCNALMEMVTAALEIPLDDTMRQVFAGYIHHLPQTENSTTLSEIGKLFYNHLAKSVTWKLDQDSKERFRAKLEREKLALVKEDGADGAGEKLEGTPG